MSEYYGAPNDFRNYLKHGYSYGDKRDKYWSQHKQRESFDPSADQKADIRKLGIELETIAKNNGLNDVLMRSPITDASIMQGNLEKAMGGFLDKLRQKSPNDYAKAMEIIKRYQRFTTKTVKRSMR